MARRQPSSVLSIFSSRIFATSSVRTRSKMAPTPAWCAVLRWTCRPVDSRMPSVTAIDRCEKPAISSSFQPTTDDLLMQPSSRASFLTSQVQRQFFREGSLNRFELGFFRLEEIVFWKTVLKVFFSRKRKSNNGAENGTNNYILRTAW